MKKMTDEQIKPALVHDWLTGMRGGEKVLQQICLLYPDSPLYTLIHEPGELSKIIENRPVYKSLLQYLPLGKRFYRYYLPLLPLLVKSLDTQKHDFVISTSHCVAKNVKAAKGGVHICYCHTPMRYIWDMFDSYFSFRKSPPVYLFMKLFLPYLRYMDVKTAANVDYFIANSGTTAQRIKKYYKREARVIYPPVDTDIYTPANVKKENFYLIVSSLVPYKKVDLAVEAFNKSGRQLRVIGSGPQEEYLKKKAGGNISFYGWLGEEEIKENYRKCRGLVFPGKEDFGIVPVEAMACGSPVIAYGKGGATESVIDEKTGLFFYEQTPEGLNEALNKFEKMEFSKDIIRKRAECFSAQRFRKEFKNFIKKKNLI